MARSRPVHPRESVELSGELVVIEPLSAEHAASLSVVADAEEVNTVSLTVRSPDDQSAPRARQTPATMGEGRTPYRLSLARSRVAEPGERAVRRLVEANGGDHWPLISHYRDRGEVASSRGVKPLERPTLERNFSGELAATAPTEQQ